MSLYQLHRCVWDSVRSGEVGSGPSRIFDLDRYDLTADERRAVEQEDVAGLYRLGLHPVLLNGYCRSIGLTREDYRSRLQVFRVDDGRKPRWRR